MKPEFISDTVFDSLHRRTNASRRGPTPTPPTGPDPEWVSWRVATVGGDPSCNAYTKNLCGGPRLLPWTGLLLFGAQYAR
ncbi:hypothetical protein GCM10012283_20200 [Phycicoccus endophyticus]|nr:hypothetical protein GCM10012283_20200 [Phycicoccus endophyticus]